MDEQEKILIQSGTVVTPETMLAADVLIWGEKIQAIGHNLPVTDDTEIVEATGLLVLPGIIDAHVHIQLDTGIYKSPSNWFTETRAAAFGVGSGVGWSLVIAAMAGIRGRLKDAPVPKPLQGLGISLVITGLMAMAFMGFKGMVKIY